MRGVARIGLRILAALAVAIWALVFVGEGRRVERDPRFCASSCHHAPGPRTAGAAADWHAGGHTGVPCQDCHTTSLATGLRLLWATYGSGKPEAHGKATAAACTDCHQKKPAEWRIIADTAGHRGHGGLQGVDCLSCHGPTTHVDAPAEQVCVSCHKDEHLHKTTTLGAETCLSCHGYSASAKNIKAPSPAACEKCHSDTSHLIASGGGASVRPMREVNEHSLHGGVACQLCHNAHGIKPKVPEGQPACNRCHQLEITQVATAPKVGPEAHRDCEGCHTPHAPAGSAVRNCIACHAKNVMGLLANGEVTTTALKHNGCASCHKPHTWKADVQGCMDCHKEQTALLQTRSPPQHKACTDCHDVHGQPPTGAICLKCHSDTKSKHVALAPDAHKDCTSCHNPHAPRPEETRSSCTKCHATELAQVTRGGPEGHAKDGCLGCHKPHDNPMPPENVCANCHAEKAKAVQTAGPSRHQECLSCHKSHDFRVTDIGATCSQCHQNLFDAVARGIASVPHRADCKSCHAFHGEPGVARASCLQCHEKVATEFHPPNEKHADCASCHQAHTPASAAPAQCNTCHADKVAVAARWPPSSAHAQACNGCHQPHAARTEKACSECHAAEATSAMGGKHQCEQCHAPHVAPPGQGAAWWQRCNDCHSKQLQSATQRGPTHSQCDNCHKPHQFAVPTCTSCHQDVGSKGLHAVPQHAASCNGCHDPHVKSTPTRQQCLACHTDKTGHEPSATTCNTCHIFQ